MIIYIYSFELCYNFSMKITANTVQEAMLQAANKDTAEHSTRFFKTGKGEYGEGDRFLGIRVPETRKFVKKFEEISLKDGFKLLYSDFHEIRLFSLLLLVQKFQKGDVEIQEKIYRFYLENTKYINNWDLVDSSAHLITGAYLIDRDKTVLYELSRSEYLFDRRISIMSTFWFIKNRKFEDTLRISEILLHDKEDLIHKAVGWMLREIGNRNLPIEEGFLKINYKSMPRTMLRYAIEKFDETKRKGYLGGNDVSKGYGYTLRLFPRHQIKRCLAH
jgi:3-methyladenine DNA glycosylase AlkD